MKKRFLSLGLAMAMAASLTACGSSSSTTETTTAAAADATTAAAGESTAASGEVFKIGGIGPVTGAAAVYGLAVKNGAQIAVDEINADGGINGYQIDFQFQDDEHDAEKSVNAYNTLKDWGMQMIMGTVTSAPCVAVADKTMADNMFQITPSGSSVECAQNPNVFRVCFSDPDQGAASATYIAENKLADKIAVIYDSSDVYSSGIYERFASEAANHGLDIVAAEAFTADSNKDFSTQLQKAKDAGADLVFLPIYYTEASLILNQANTMGYAPKFFGCDGMDGILGVENFDTSLAEGVMLLTPFSATAEDEKSQAFVKAYEAANKDEVPNQFAADTYDVLYAMKAAADAAEITPDMENADISAAMSEAMLSVELDGLTGKAKWTEDGECDKEPKAFEIQDGAYVEMD